MRLLRRPPCSPYPPNECAAHPQLIQVSSSRSCPGSAGPVRRSAGVALSVSTGKLFECPYEISFPIRRACVALTVLTVELLAYLLISFDEVEICLALSVPLTGSCILLFSILLHFLNQTCPPLHHVRKHTKLLTLFFAPKPE